MSSSRFKWDPHTGWYEVDPATPTFNEMWSERREAIDEVSVGDIGPVPINSPNAFLTAPTPAPRSGIADALSRYGIVRAPEVVELAAAAGLDLAAACTMLEKESGGGRNVWGHDNVPTAGTYTPGSEVTREDYQAYHTAVLTGRAGRQGCGPCQLTWGGYQDAADKIGGCWDWRANVRVGFDVLARSIRANGLRNGFRTYNGSGQAAENYADDAIRRYAVWRSRLSGAPVPRPGETLTDEEHGMLVAIYSQLSGSPTLGQWPGWQSWAGGTDESLTMVDYLRRTNVEVRQTWNAIKTIQTKLDSFSVSPAGDLGSLSQSDVNRIAGAVVAMLSQKLASP